MRALALALALMLAAGAGAQNLGTTLPVRGLPSSPDENEDGDSDASPRKAPARPESLTASNAKKITDIGNVSALFKAAAAELADLELNASLVGGNKYMISDCLGVKASAGNFTFKPDLPAIRQEGTGVVMTFNVDRITLDGLMIRVRPNPNVAKLCKFSKKFGVGGTATNVRLELRVDPLLDLEQCRVLFAGPVRTNITVGGLNLRPLQNDLDRVAKNMIEDALNRMFDGGSADAFRKAWTRALGATSCRPNG